MSRSQRLVETKIVERSQFLSKEKRSPNLTLTFQWCFQIQGWWGGESQKVSVLASSVSQFGGPPFPSGGIARGWPSLSHSQPQALSGRSGLPSRQHPAPVTERGLFSNSNCDGIHFGLLEKNSKSSE